MSEPRTAAGPFCPRCGHDPHDERDDPRCPEIVAASWSPDGPDLEYCGCVDIDALFVRMKRAEAVAPTPAEPLDVELERLARRLSDEFVAGDPEAGGLSSILQHAAREYRARLAPSTPTGEEEDERP